MSKQRRPSQSSAHPLTIEQILRWADAHHARSGKWPTMNSGAIPDTSGTTWNMVYQALYHGFHGLPGGSSLARLLAEHRGVRNRVDSPLTVQQILQWADAHYRRKGKWPAMTTGKVIGCPGESWRAIDHALRRGSRGLPGGQSLSQLLHKQRGARSRNRKSRLSVGQVLTWADAHYRRFNRWPDSTCGRVVGTIDESWQNIDAALNQGHRGLPSQSSLAKLLAQYRGVRRRRQRPPLSIPQILAWADAHRERTGAWPTEDSGPVEGTDGENWRAIGDAMRRGKRGLTAGPSLPELLNVHRGRPCRRSATRLTIRQILAWADEHHRLHDCWPGSRSGDVAGSPGEKWANIDTALSMGGRGLRGGWTLARLLSERRGVPHTTERPPLTVQKIVAWAKSHHARTGSWPTCLSGDLMGVPGENWNRISNALQKGNRGLPGNSSLRRLLAETRGVRDRRDRPRLSVDQILAWADAHHRRTGRWPNVSAGKVHDAPGETWLNINVNLREGLRGLLRGSSLAKLLAQHRGLRNRGELPQITIPQIMEWMEAHRRRTGSWPTRKSGGVLEAPGETWSRIENALYAGRRGLPSGSSLARLRRQEARIALV